MKGILIFALLLLGSASAMAQAAAVKPKANRQGPTAEAAKRRAPAQEQNQKTEQPVAVDELFTETYENYLWLVQEINRLEQATGQVEIRVSIRELRRQRDEKVTRLRAWMTEHKVPLDWSYAAQEKVLVPPPVQPAPPLPPPAVEKK